MSVSPNQAVDAANRAFGRHPGSRALHARGTLCQGTFKATPEAAALTRAAHLRGAEVPVTVRFSNGAGDPGHPDWVPDPRGLATKFYLPDGGRTDLVAVSSPRFPVRDPEGFVQLLKLQSAGPAATWKLPLFLRRYPEALRTLPALLPSLKPPVSYATIPYYAIHAYRWLDASGGDRYVRYTWRPLAGTHRLSLRTARRRPKDYLQTDLLERMQRAPLEFALEVQIAEPDDSTVDPSAAWSGRGRRVTVGVLRVTGPDHEREQGDDVLVFDPSRVTDGIECSEDPVLQFRPRAYSESVRRRTDG
jgi:catalase